MSFEDVERLLKRAEKFRKDAINSFNEGYYDFTYFYAEQAIQLKLIAFIFLKLLKRGVQILSELRIM